MFMDQARRFKHKTAPRYPEDTHLQEFKDLLISLAHARSKELGGVPATLATVLLNPFIQKPTSSTHPPLP
jgi:hypothetical protein